tara:strand:+ start:502 stop:1083 length:582 start_codon:yes stop_codon:yes gene_type:complete
MSAKTQINKIKTLLGLEIKLEQMKLENGTVLEAEAFEAGAEIFIVNEEDRIAVPMGEYMLEDGKVLIVAEDGIIGEIKEGGEAPTEEAAPEAEVEVEAEAAPTSPKKVVESISKEMFFAEIDKLRNEIAELKAAKIEVKEELSADVKVELSAEETKPLKHNPEGNVEKKELLKFGSKAPQTTKDVVFGKLFNQ